MLNDCYQLVTRYCEHSVVAIVSSRYRNCYTLYRVPVFLKVVRPEFIHAVFFSDRLCGLV
jgi:hypothetical protein